MLWTVQINQLCPSFCSNLCINLRGRYFHLALFIQSEQAFLLEEPHRTGPSILQLTSCKMVRHVADFLKTSFSLGGDNRFFNIWKDLLGTSFALQSFSWPKLFFPWHIDFLKKFKSPSFFWFKYVSGLKGISFQNLQTNYYQKKSRKEILPRKELSWEMSLRISDPPGFSLRRGGSSGIKTWFWNCDPGHIV